MQGGAIRLEFLMPLQQQEVVNSASRTPMLDKRHYNICSIAINSSLCMESVRVAPTWESD